MTFPTMMKIIEDFLKEIEVSKSKGHESLAIQIQDNKEAMKYKDAIVEFFVADGIECYIGPFTNSVTLCFFWGSMISSRFKRNVLT